mgnify:CR=1 FL=1|jgi:hypothetical protein
MTHQEVGEWRLPSPACFAVVGPSRAGKSTLISNIVCDVTVWQDRPNHVIYSGPVVTRTSPYITELERECYKQGMRFNFMDSFPSLQEVQMCAGVKVPVILILDDVQVWEKHHRPGIKATKLLTAQSHHDGITVFFVLHNAYHPSFRDINNNVAGRFLMYQNSDWNKYYTMSLRLYGKGFSDFLKYCLQEAKNKYNTRYIYVNTDTQQKFSSRHNCYTCILKEEREPFGNNPIAFDLENYDKN